MAFLYSRWLALPLSTRVKLATEFGIAKTGSTHVVDNRVESDGYNINTVEAALEAHENDWDEIVAKAEGRMVVKVDEKFLEENPVLAEAGVKVGDVGVEATPEASKKLTEEHLNKKTTRAKSKPKKGK